LRRVAGDRRPVGRGFTTEDTENTEIGIEKRGI